MAKKYKERFDALEQEVSKMKYDLQKLPVMEQKLATVMKNIERHKCKESKMRELRMFVINGDNVEEEIIEEEYYEQKELSMFEMKGGMNVVVDLSINLVVGLTNLGTMKLSTKETSHYGVVLGSGIAIKGKGVCENMELLNDWKVTADFLPLELGEVDAILGMQWLYSLGVTEMDWKNLMMTFFQGKIRCNSLYSSPVLLVKKKDGSWRFCVDYRAFNNATMPNKFHIPVIEELFDELNGANLFSKIDLKDGYHQIRMHKEDIKKTAFRIHEEYYEFLVMPFSRGIEEHVYQLELVLEVLCEHKLYANKKKCNFAYEKVEYLGHIISRNGVENDGSTATPLTQLLKLGAFKWNKEAKMAFERLQEAMMTLPVLALPDFDVPFEIEIDASGYGIGAVLMQNKRSITFLGHTLALRHRVKPVYERELMAVVLAVQLWRPYLLGRKFVVKTYQKSLKFLLEQRVIQPQYQKWIAKLLGYSFEVVYKPGLKNETVDALSRVPSSIHLNQLTALALINLKIIKEEVEKDKQFKEILMKLRSGVEVHNYALQQEMLQYKGRLVIANKSTLIPAILYTYHNFVFGGHSGFLRTYKRLTGELFWHGMKGDVQKHCEECIVCQINKTLSLSPAGLLTPLEIPTKIWDDILMDFIKGLPKAAGLEVIFVIVDRFSKYAHFLTLKHPFDVKIMAKLFVKEVTEVVNHSVEAYLRCFYGERSRKWVKWIHWAEYWYNTTYQCSLGVSPFQRDVALGALKEHLRVAQEKMKTSNLKQRHVKFEEGDMVYLKLRPFRQFFIYHSLNELLECQNPQELAPYMTENHEWLAVPDEADDYQKNNQGC
ncbi:Transposon Ty3-G Gag-Pol polyprotein [Cucumis melo var. makuwa]|uniref:Transposon Ty3-G Gag-Pol polyprotein n=1 Tax=Cucumis melo var. makuwa TaxID=1194695 RepID=A0A5A7T5M0_CUCMM|nr:Transposon Ty3-G Gag-Pol polyprotein [Cucumis melo var. makuwa]TYK27344.1 Transposon Ty3-G Gag-Pol polyprotein [Cucumis melo var. makuwa]